IGGERGRRAPGEADHPHGSDKAGEEWASRLEVNPADDPLHAKVKPGARDLVVRADRDATSGEDHIVAYVCGLFERLKQRLGAAWHNAPVVDEPADCLEYPSDRGRAGVDDPAGR